ncbi:MAG: hypothetical protein ACREBG_31315 [Pyrinomonadaceae bacterium]
MKNRVFVAFLLLGLCATQVAAQGQPDLDRLDEKLSRHIETKMPGWKHKRVEPFMNSPNVLVEVWSLPKRGVMVQIVQYKSHQEAREVLRGFLQYESEKEELKGLGDEAYAWGIRRANVVFTRGNFIVYVEAGADIDADPEARGLSGPQRFDREKTEVKRLSTEFAKHMVSAIDLP